MLFGLPFLGVGVWLLGSLAGARNQMREIRESWIRLPATIVAHDSLAIGIRQRFHRPTVRYAYEHQGTRYESNRHDLLEEFPIVSTSLGRRGKLPYTVGQTVKAYVNPKEPVQSVLSLELQYESLLGSFGLIFFLIGGAFLLGPPLARWLESEQRRNRERGILTPRFETSQLGLGVLTAVAFLITLATGLVLTEAGAWSVPAAILVAVFGAGTAALARLVIREHVRRRPFAACRILVKGHSWSLSDPRGRLISPVLELVYREEVRSMGEDGPGRWMGRDLVCSPLAGGSLQTDSAQPDPVDELFLRRYWAVRIRDEGREALFPL
jgi:hypothetical protein